MLKLQRLCRSPYRARKLLLFCHTVVRAPKSPSPGVHFGISGVAGIMADGMSYKQTTEVGVLPVADLFKESAKYHFFSGRCNTGDNII